jgi:hypothetical protein
MIDSFVRKYNIVQAPRASAILYNILKNHPETGFWLLPANVCPVVPITFLKAQTSFEFVDISPETLQMDWATIETLVQTGKFRGLLYAHTYGESSVPYEFFSSLKASFPTLMIIDDRCLCIPQLKPDYLSPADVQLYSTGYGKIVDLHFGGYAFMQNDINYELMPLPFAPHHYDEIEKQYKQAISQRTRFLYQDSDWLDNTSPMPPWDQHCRQITVQLPKSVKHSSALNAIYAKKLPVEIQLPQAFQDWRFNIRVKNKQRILAAIFSTGLFASSHYASLTGVLGEGDGHHAEMLASVVINLFNDYHFTTEQAEQVCEIILKHLD